MRPWDETEYPRYQGMPADRQPQAEPGRADLHWLLHPIVWVRWRAEVRHMGPFAPDFDDFRLGQRGADEETHDWGTP